MANGTQNSAKQAGKAASGYGPRAPQHLSAEARDWWKAVVAEVVDLTDSQLKVLQAAAEAWDRCQQARRAIAELGLTFDSKNGPKVRPEVTVENLSAIRFARLVRELNLDIAPPAEPPRPPRIGGRY
jgi:P27 family predicted phage terminase small subunit